MKKREQDSTRASTLSITLGIGLISIGAILPASFLQPNAETGGLGKKSQLTQADSARVFAKLTTGAVRAALPPRQLTLADRVAYQYAIEEIYWRHRIWPKENAEPKPSLGEVMSREQIEQKVERYLRDSQLLADQWQRPITPEQLQAEMNRMASQSKQPEVLQEIVDALGNDPALIAECLARPVLAERLVRQLYAHDEGLHGALRHRAESEVRAHPSVNRIKQTSGTYSEMELIKSEETAAGTSADVGATPPSGVGQDVPQARGYNQRQDLTTTVQLNSREWDESIERLAAQFDQPAYEVWSRQRGIAAFQSADALAHSKNILATLKTGVMSSLQEDDTRYYARAVLEKGKDRLKVATVSWQKEPFESWAEKSEPAKPETNNEAIFEYQLPEIAAPSPRNPAMMCNDTTWIPTNTNAPTGRYGHTAVWTGSEMIVWGGSTNGNPNIGGRYDPSTDSWAPTSTTNAPAGAFDHTAVWTGREMIVWGGGGGLNTGGRYNPCADSWTATSTTSVPTGRWGHTAVWTGSEMIVWGGNSGSGGTLNTGGRYNPITDSWIATSTINAPAARDSHTAVWTGNEMIVWGGAYYDGGYHDLNSGGRYNPSTDSWVATSTINAPDGRPDATAVWTGSEMIAWGGLNGNGSLNSGGRYNPSTDSWVATSTTNAPQGRYYHTAAWTGSEMIAWGGYTSESNYVNTGGRYNPSTDSWTATSTINAPDARVGHIAIWTGSEMIVWGGDGISLLNSGGRYDPGTDSWIATSITNAPDARFYHTAVWTGSEMIAWGGYTSESSNANTGGRYNPSTDSWTATSTINAPDPREGHTAIWTGSEMIIWGGYGTSDLNSGSRYNPSTDSWVATSTTNAPAARDSHTAVWTGNEMIVWGGESGTVLQNSGGRYDPSTDSWVATSTTNAPDRRYYHTAVWTGSEMIIWGGYSGSDVNSGGRYNPSTDSWVATTLSNAPSPRESHTAVWTGSEMIVWGGYYDDGNLHHVNTGGSYNPSADSWIATSTTNAPDARFFHTAVWTGSEMIVWGGGYFSGYNFITLNSGGRYNPSTDSWVATSSTNAPDARAYHTAVWTGSAMIVWGGNSLSNPSNTGGRYLPLLTGAASRKTHGGAGDFDIDLPFAGTPGIECRTGGATNDYQMLVVFGRNVTVTGNPQAAVTSGTGTIGSGGVPNGGMVIVNGNIVTVPLTNVGNAQTITVTLYGVSGTGDVFSLNVSIPMSLLIGDASGNGTVNAADVALCKSHLGQPVDATNFRSDVNANGAINSGDVAITKADLGTGLP